MKNKLRVINRHFMSNKHLIKFSNGYILEKSGGFLGPQKNISYTSLFENKNEYNSFVGINRYPSRKEGELIKYKK